MTNYMDGQIEDFLEKWSSDGCLQTFEDRSRFRHEARSLLAQRQAAKAVVVTDEVVHAANDVYWGVLRKPENHLQPGISLIAMRAALESVWSTAGGDGLSVKSGIEKAAQWVDNRRWAFEESHGQVDPDTGTLEFKRQDQDEYACELAEIADGIRAIAAAEGEKS